MRPSYLRNLLNHLSFMTLLLPPQLIGLFDLQPMALIMKVGYLLQQSLKLTLMILLLTLELYHNRPHFLVNLGKLSLFPPCSNLQLCP